MSSLGPPPVVSPAPPLLLALTAPLLPVLGSLAWPVVPVPSVAVAAVVVVVELVASLAWPVLCVCPCDAPLVVGASPLVVGVVALTSVPAVTVLSVALTVPALVPALSLAEAPVPASPHPNIPAVATRASPCIHR